MRDLSNLGDKNKEVLFCYFYSIKVRVLIYVYLLRLEFLRFTFKLGEVGEKFFYENCVIYGID